MSNYNRTLSQLLLDHRKLEEEHKETLRELERYQNPGASSCEDFIVWKKEICSLVVDGEEPTEFMRLEFQEIWDCDIILDWLEPTIHEGEAALILHCHRKE